MWVVKLIDHDGDDGGGGIPRADLVGMWGRLERSIYDVLKNRGNIYRSISLAPTKSCNRSSGASDCVDTLVFPSIAWHSSLPHAGTCDGESLLGWWAAMWVASVLFEFHTLQGLCPGRMDRPRNTSLILMRQCNKVLEAKGVTNGKGANIPKQTGGF